MKCASTCARARSISLRKVPSSVTRCSSMSMMRRNLGQRRPGAAVATSRKNPASSRELWYADTSSATRLFVDQRAVEPRRLAVGEQIGEQVHLGVTLGEHRRRIATPCTDAASPRGPRARAALRGRASAAACDGRGRGPAGRSPKYCSARSKRARRVDVARQRERRIRRVIVGAKEIACTSSSCIALMSLARTDGQPVVRMIARETAPRRSP